ncbi:MAG: hypothetical protein GYA55_15215 [SAR324 cluster bacterium]|uniref:Uncharacterized protein n=1 Tax=SAR324 cluster bacterium TaxID=2024889 RepID=A0A7X9ILT4_9DELT|nr:hypothetical protein [SAR324 cluster bacterium]
MRKNKWFLINIGLLKFLLCFNSTALLAKDHEFCVYITENGEFKSSSSISSVPFKYRTGAKCFDKKRQDFYLAPPDEIKLKGAQLENTLSTALGLVHLRGVRSMESVFGRSPNRAISEATQTVSRVLRQPGWPSNIGVVGADWKVIFLDEKLP